MPRRARLVLPAALVLGAMACSPVEPSLAALELRVERRLDTDTALQLGYHFEVTNRGTRTLWFPSCGQVVAPDIAIEVNGREVDRVDGTLCNGQVDARPVSLLPGASLGGLRSVPRRTGARYVPTVRYATQADLVALRQIGAAAFEAP